MLVYQRMNTKTKKVSNRRYASDKKFTKSFKIGKTTYKPVKFRKLKSNEKGVTYI